MDEHRFVACLQAIQDAKIARKQAPTPEAVSLFFIRLYPCSSVVKNLEGLYHPADVFTSDGAEDAFLKCLGEVCEKPGWMVHGYVDMRNDYHVA